MPPSANEGGPAPDERGSLANRLFYLVANSTSHRETSSTSVELFEDSVRTCLDDLERALDSLGCQVVDLVKVTVYIPEERMTPTDYAEYNRVYRNFFERHGIDRKPARSTVGVHVVNGLPAVRAAAVALARRHAATDENVLY